MLWGGCISASFSSASPLFFDITTYGRTKSGQRCTKKVKAEAKEHIQSQIRQIVITRWQTYRQTVRQQSSFPAAERHLQRPKLIRQCHRIAPGTSLLPWFGGLSIGLC